jgi:hypothetical protein
MSQILNKKHFLHKPLKNIGKPRGRTLYLIIRLNSSTVSGYTNMLFETPEPANYVLA